MKRSETFYILLGLAAAVLWGTTGTSQSFAPSEVSPLSIGAVRLAIGGTVLLFYAWRQGALAQKSIWFKPGPYIAAACMASYQLLFFAGVLKTGVALGTMVALGSSPVFAGVISLAYRRENPGRNWMIATMFTVAGCMLLIAGGQQVEVNVMGILMALCAGLSYAIYAAACKDLLAVYRPEAVAASAFFIGGILLSPFLVSLDLSWLAEPSGAIVALHLGLLTTAVAYVLFSYCLANVALPKAVTLSLAEPLTAAALGMLLLKERLSLISQGGMLLIFAGLLVLSLAGLVKTRKASA